MAIGAFSDREACMLALKDNYPDAATRERVCGALQTRLEAAPAVEGKEVSRVEASVTVAATVEEASTHWLVRNIIATREGVSLGWKVLKRGAAVKQTASLLEGAPIIYGAERHLKPDGLDPDPRSSPGFAVNGRHEGDAAVYDAILWKSNPAGYRVPEADLKHNKAFVEMVRQGRHIHNSLGSLGMERMTTGEAPPMGGGAAVRYEAEQVQVLKVGHIAILEPVATGKGSCPAPACGAMPNAPKGLAETLGVREDAVLIAAGLALRRAEPKP